MANGEDGSASGRGGTADVLIVGAGPTGLMLAIELRRRGVECVVVDALDAPLHWDRSTVIHPRSLELFDALGIVDRFLEAGVPQRTISVRGGGELLGVKDLSACGSPYGFNIGISEEVTESILAGVLGELGGEVMRGRRLTGLERRGGAAVAKLGHDGGEEEVVAAWVVGCDGYHSAVRELSGIGLDGHEIDAPWAVFDVELAGWEEAYDGNYAFLDDPPVIITALPQHRWRAYTRPAGPDSDPVAATASVVASYWPRVRAERSGETVRFHCHAKVATSYRSGNVLLAGDAAHVCSPAQGHGMNAGLQDAFNLGWKLALVCRGTASPALLDSYGPERRPVAAGIAASGDEAEAGLLLADPAARAERDAAIRAALADPAVRHQEAIAEAELNVSYAGSPIVAGAAGPAPGAGERLPDLGPVRPAGGEEGGLQALLRGRREHLLILLTAARMPAAAAAELLERLRAEAGATPVFEDVTALSAAAEPPAGFGSLSAELADRLGVEEATVLAVRPDGHVGLRSDGADPAAVGRYAALLRGG